MRTPGILLATSATLLTAGTALALPRPHSRVLAGANHHIGDASYVAKYGHGVDAHASETDRMHQHLQFVRDWLASRPPTRPELAARRAEILAAFDTYIAKYTTPKNDHVPWRTPVFIDDEGTICAVGYLIQQTTNHALPEKIAAAHRYDFIEDIARDMPEVAAWVADSGFTLDEISHIQPAYAEPESQHWETWDLAHYRHPDGAFDKLDSRGTLRKNRMEGDWVSYATDDTTHEQTITGRGTMKHGTGTWTAVYDDGTRFAEGKYVDNVAQGPWQIFGAGGNLIAEGAFSRGTRAGLWKFYQDTPAKTPIAIGRFDRAGKVTGAWRHFDENGKLLATSTTATPDQWDDPDWDIDGGEGVLFDVVAAPGEVAHVSHTGTVKSRTVSLDSYALGGERIYVHAMYEHTTIYDADGYSLVRADDGTWTAANCNWNAKRKAYAHRGDIVPLHGALYAGVRLRLNPKPYQGIGSDSPADETGPACGAPKAVAAARAAKLEPLYAAMTGDGAETTEDVRTAVLDEEAALAEGKAIDRSPEAVKARRAKAVASLRADSAMFIEWPHIDGTFVELYHHMAGRKFRQWGGGDPEKGLYDDDKKPGQVAAN